MIERVDIIGLGALGVMYADFFSHALGKGQVRILADSSRIARYRTEGITFNGAPCDFNYCDCAQETIPSQLLIYAVKYGGLRAAIAQTKHLVDENTIVISVLNGIRSEDDLRAAFGKKAVIYCTAQKMAALKEGNRAVCKNPGELAIGITADGSPEKLESLKAFFTAYAFPFSLPADIHLNQWSKLLCNVGVNQTVALYEGTYRTVQAPGDAREMMKAAMRETVAVAQAEQIGLTEQDVINWCEVIDTLDPDSEPSMRQDAKAGRVTEVDLFAGTICALGKKHGIPTPVNDRFLSAFFR